VDGIFVGAVYLTRQREVGIGILKAHRGHGYAEKGIRLLLEQHPGRALANINPSNGASIRLFHKLGFEGPVQITLERA
jgi:RimJ/RimL family protein N-acetyltransferase